MYYRLRDGLSFCQVDGELIFLDLDNDQYFQLPKRLEQGLTSEVNSAGEINSARRELIRRRILVETTFPQESTSSEFFDAPACSALEVRPQHQSLSLSTLFEVLVLIGSTQVQLKSRKLSSIIASLVAYRRNQVESAGAASSTPLPPSLLEATAAFLQARLYIPIEPCCLLDSLSLVRFLARRRLSASIVFAVTTNPFNAHCWVQSGDLVLNDTVGNAILHTPIRVV